VNLLSLARRVALAALALLLPATLFAQGGGTRLSELAIEIWPEFDRPAALVILRGAIAEGVKLPAPVSLRLPASSEGPAAVAYSSSPDGSLLNLRHDTATVGGVTTVKFEAPERYFHIEFYESMSTSGAARNYTYTWPGDLAVDRASVVVQEPASAQGMTTDPVLGNLSSGTAGLTYRAGDLGALAQGKPRTIAIRYSKADARPSVEIKGMRTAQAAAPAAGQETAHPAAGLPVWVVPMAALAALALAGVLGIAYRWRRTGARSADAYCSKCGAPLRSGDRFCGKCGAKAAA
jgi:hypothetical protein